MILINHSRLSGAQSDLLTENEWGCRWGCLSVPDSKEERDEVKVLRYV